MNPKDLKDSVAAYDAHKKEIDTINDVMNAHHKAMFSAIDMLGYDPTIANTSMLEYELVHLANCIAQCPNQDYIKAVVDLFVEEVGAARLRLDKDNK